MSWRTFGNRRETVIEEGDLFHRFGDKRTVEFNSPDEAVELTLTECESGLLRGWIPTGATDPTLVAHHRTFSMSFPYGVALEVAAGTGRIVHLHAESTNP